VHANSALQALSRLATLCLRADVDIPFRAVQGEIGDLIDLVIYIERRDGIRRVREALELKGFDAERGCYETKSIYS
jgi:Flp pilus assembly CpaF family ATPase